MKKILIFDNYDSFTYNLLHTVQSLGYTNVDVIRNNRMTLEEVERYDKIILSPGPGLPEEAGLLLPLIERYATSKSILGVCLGHQAIGQVFGAKLENIPFVFHGVQTPAQIVAEDYLFTGLPEEIAVGRYHSWIVARENFPAELEVTALDNAGAIMAMRHRTLDLHGVQFHPESILTPEGTVIIRNFLEHPVLSKSISE
ncbi:aminodeoxychorismate/anthranilate synthase component II [Dysgonomonadaceae bacterium zrk40]|nr:aminodeoxychorismate/anthranilate synthase component II [Dysgonomonadaceae bacterium zrk40]